MAEIHVPFLVTTEKLNNTILGFNAVKHLVQNRDDTESIASLFKTVFDEVGRDKMETKERRVQDKETGVKVKGKDVIIPSGKIVQINCKTNAGLLEKQRAMIFQQKDVELPEGIRCADSVVLLKPGIKNYFRVPAIIDISHANAIRKNLTIEHLEYVSSIVPLEVTAKTESNINKQKPSTISVLEISEKSTSENEGKDCDHQHQQKVLEKTDLLGLTYDQREQVRALIKEENSVFSVDDDDVDNATSYQMRIHLSDKTPVQQNDNSIPKTLYDELKSYIDDLLDKKWIINSHSSYSSPVVAVRKKGGSLRLCSYYRKLNSRTTPDRDPLPRIQNIIEKLEEISFSDFWIRVKLTTSFTLTQPAESTQHSSFPGAFMNGSRFDLV